MSIHRDNLAVSQRCGIPYEGLIVGRAENIPIFDDCGEQTPGSVLLLGSEKFIEAVEASEPYSYCKNGGTRTRREFWCKQVSRKNVSANTSSGPHPKRMKIRHRTMNCGGRIIVSCKGQLVQMRLRHVIQHNSPREKVAMPDEVRCRIRELAVLGMAPFQVLTTLRTEGIQQYDIVYDDVTTFGPNPLHLPLRKATIPLKE